MGKHGVTCISVLAFMMFIPFGRTAYAAEPLVRCVLIYPPEVPEFPDAQQRITQILLDLQWWYSCQMEGNGYGAKTFELERDRNGKASVRVARLVGKPPSNGNDIAHECVKRVRDLVPGPADAAHGVVLIVYGGYVWEDEQKLLAGSGAQAGIGSWAFLTANHYQHAIPTEWRNNTNVLDDANQRLFSPLHWEVLKASDSRKSISFLVGFVYGSFAHELGHAFGLRHPPDGNKGFSRNIMGPARAEIAGNFLDEAAGTCCCLIPTDAAYLNANPMFAEREVQLPSSGASREVGMRGASNTRKPPKPDRTPQTNTPP